MNLLALFGYEFRAAPYDAEDYRRPPCKRLRPSVSNVSPKRLAEGYVLGFPRAQSLNLLVVDPQASHSTVFFGLAIAVTYKLPGYRQFLGLIGSDRR